MKENISEDAVFQTVSYRKSKASTKWKRGYIKPIYAGEMATHIPFIIRYELYDEDKKTLIRSYTINEAEQAKANDLIVKAQNLKLHKTK
ncbi:MAG: hypothetical protein ACYDCN_13395 [Bacteroidia bacterium]